MCQVLTYLGLEEISVKTTTTTDNVLALMELIFWLGNAGNKYVNINKKMIRYW